jgi:hypothetical protein
MMSPKVIGVVGRNGSGKDEIVDPGMAVPRNPHQEGAAAE